MTAVSLPEVLTVEEVMELYRLQDRRSARRVMDEAGAFLIGGRLLIRTEDLLAHEAELKARRRPADVERAPRRSPSQGAHRPIRQRRSSGPLAPDWWRPEHLPPEGEEA